MCSQRIPGPDKSVNYKTISFLQKCAGIPPNRTDVSLPCQVDDNEVLGVNMVNLFYELLTARFEIFV